MGATALAAGTKRQLQERGVRLLTLLQLPQRLECRAVRVVCAAKMENNVLNTLFFETFMTVSTNANFVVPGICFTAFL